MNWDLISKNISNEDNSEYILITRDNIDELKVGSYIKYMKDDKMVSGGFLLKVLEPTKIVYTELLLKSNIIWKLRFIKYKIYMKNKKINVIFNEYKDEILNRKKELDEEINSKLQTINLNKNKYKININN